MNFQNQYYQPMISPYQYQQQSYLPQNFNQQLAKSVLNGKYVNDFSEVTANDVPMDSNSIFIKSDGSEIQIRSWNGNGLIDVKTYKPILDNKNENVSICANEVEKSNIDISERFTALFNKLDEIENKLDKTKSTSRTKKEGDTE